MIYADVVTSSSMPTIMLPSAIITKILGKPTYVENEGPVTSTRTKLVTITNDDTTARVKGVSTTPPPPPPQVHMTTKTTATMVFQTTATMHTPNYVEEPKQTTDRSSIITTNNNNDHLLVHREPEESSKKNKDTLTVTNMKTTFVTISYSSHEDASLDHTTTTTTTGTTTTAAASPDPHSDATDGGVPTWTADETTPTEKPSGGTIFCPFKERPDIYTLCVLGQTGVVPPTATARTKTSAAYGMMARNPLARLRVAVVSSSLWDPIRALAAETATAATAAAGGDVHGNVGEQRMNLRWGSRCPVAAATTIVAGFEEEEQETFTFEEDGKGKGEEDAAEAQIAHLKKNLDAARDLIRAQQQLLDGQHAIIAEYKESLAQAVKLLAEAIVGGS